MSPAKVVDLFVRYLDVEGTDVGCGLDGGGHESLPLRSDLNAARSSVVKSSGSSQAAKWPPLAVSLK
jgi:hypothetical protein